MKCRKGARLLIGWSLYITRRLVGIDLFRTPGTGDVPERQEERA